MYLRIVRLRVLEGEEAAFTRFYEGRVIPALAATPGCRYAGLLAPWRGVGHQSLTIWESPAAARLYEEKGIYQQLLLEAAPMLSEQTEWRLRLARDPLETADPQRQVPSAGYRVEADAGSAALESGGRRPFVRIVSMRIAPDRHEEFVGIFAREVIPVLQATSGCRGVFLAEGADDLAGALSITLWDREEDAVRYEMSGEFERLRGRLRATFSPVYDWQATLGASSTRDVEVSSYQLVRGRRVGSDDASSS